MELPLDARVRRVGYDVLRDCIVIIVQSATFDRVAPNCIPEDYWPMIVAQPKPKPS